MDLEITVPGFGFCFERSFGAEMAASDGATVEVMEVCVETL